MLAAASKSIGLLPSGVGGMKKLIKKRDDGDDGDEDAEASSKRRKVNSKQKAVTPRTKGKPQHDDTPEKMCIGEIEHEKKKDVILKGRLVTAAKSTIRTYMVAQTVQNGGKFKLIAEITASHCHDHRGLMEQVCTIIYTHS